MKNRKLSTVLLVVFAIFCMIVGLGIHYYLVSDDTPYGFFWGHMR